MSHLSGAGGWLAANAAAWALGMPLVFLGADLASRGGPIPVVAGILAAALLATGSVVGAIHGLWLVWRLGGQPVANPHQAAPPGSLAAAGREID